MNTNDEPDGPITLKIEGLPEYNEREYMKFKYDLALLAMIRNPSQQNIEAFGKANCDLFEVEDAYRIGAALLIQFNRFRLKISQRLQLL
jgi:hypothetical protein